ncbi:uncharacterized protein [Lepeophtheirus salmonis]|uniref:uncharacterized protein n=1 Tax=Lepeophtheirus salmonis TaxID=72036 RepID=UPI001AE56CE8|nr:transcription elongation factor B polypeptide 3-like [Lepeophtheirus salmonis]XP_040569073.1 transcription elongation factor B polypeptide 3-like [Lepeophtheirus salmonis]
MEGIMSSSSSSSSAVISHYKRKMERHPKESEVLLHCLSKLDRVEVNIALLQETGIGRIVNSLKKSEQEEVSEKARLLVAKWKDVVAKEDDEEEDISGPSTTQDQPQETEDEPEEEEDVENEPEEEEEDVKNEPEEEEPELEEEEEEKPAMMIPPPTPSPPRSSSSSHHKKHKKKKSSHRDDDRESSYSSQSHGSGSSSSSSSKKQKKETLKASDSFGNALMNISSSSSSKKKKSSKEDRSESSSHKRSQSESASSSSKRSHSESSSSSSSKKSHHQESSRSLSSSSYSSSKKNQQPQQEESLKKSEKNNLTLPLSPAPPIPSDLLLPAISPNYKPLPPKKEANNGTKKYQNDDEALSSLISMSKSSKRTAVFSGVKKSGYFGPIPTLLEMCITVLQENVDDIYECGGLDFVTLKPILERASPQALSQIEEHNQYLMTETGELWERFCKKNFPKEKRQEMESWREMFERCTVEREEKLNLLKVKVKDSYKKVESSYRQTKLAYVGTVAKPPRSVFRAQAKNGTAIPFGNPLKRPMVNTSSGGGGSSSSSSSRPSSSLSSAPKKPKIAPLMSKTLKMARGIKGGFRR